MSTRRWSFLLRAGLATLAILGFIFAGFVEQPIRAVLIVFGAVVGGAWLVGILVSNHYRRQYLQRLRAKSVDED